MQAPGFWQRDDWLGRALSGCLAPAAWLYGTLAARRQRRARPARLALPLVCLGNLVSGGAGKTPAALAVARRLIERGHRPVFLTRGYGGREAGPLLVDPARHDAAAVGDEPLLLARLAPVVVARDRVAGAATALAAGADVVVMDDGYQNPSLAKDLSILVFDGAQGLGNGRVLPAGPLRERPAEGLARADAILVIGARGPNLADRLLALGGPRPLLSAELVASGPLPAGRRLLAFAGIGRPQKFFDTLRAAGAQLAATRAFPDHHPYRPAELAALRAEAQRLGAALITTEKDLMRLPPAARSDIEALAVTLAFDDREALDRLLDPLFAPPAA